MFSFSKKQLNHLLLLFFILSFVGGSIFFDFKIFGIQFYAYRLLVLLGLGYFLLSRQLVLYSSKYEKYVFWFLSVWFVYAIGSLYWCPDRAQGFKEVIYIFIGFSSYLFLLTMRNKVRNFEEKFAEFWIFVFFSVVVFSINEIITKSHFQSSFTESIAKFGEAHKINSVPVFTFDNPNHYAIYLCVTIVFAIYLILKRIHIKLSILALVCALAMLYYMESRFSHVFVFFAFLAVLHFKREWLKQLKYYAYLKWTGIALGSLMLVGVTVLIVKKLDQQHNVSTGSEATYSILVEKNKDSLNAAGAGNDVCLGMDIELEYRASFKKEIVHTRYIDLEKYAGENGSFLKKYPHIQKIAFPVACILIALILAFVVYKQKTQKGRILLIFGGFVGLILIGIFSRHIFERVNEKWSNYVVVEVLDEEKTDSVARTLLQDERLIKRVSFQDATSKKFMAGEEVTLQIADLPVSSREDKGSDAVRKKLILAGLDYLKDSHFIGAGAGSYSALTLAGKSKYDLGTINSPHNLTIEILAQYGIGITLFFIAILLYPLIYLVKDFRAKKWGINHLTLLLLLVCFFLMSNSNSTSLPLPIIWINFTLVILFFSKLISAKENENDSTN